MSEIVLYRSTNNRLSERLSEDRFASIVKRGFSGKYIRCQGALGEFSTSTYEVKGIEVTFYEDSEVTTVTTSSFIGRKSKHIKKLEEMLKK